MQARQGTSSVCRAASVSVRDISMASEGVLSCRVRERTQPHCTTAECATQSPNMSLQVHKELHAAGAQPYVPQITATCCIPGRHSIHSF